MKRDMTLQSKWAKMTEVQIPKISLQIRLHKFVLLLLLLFLKKAELNHRYIDYVFNVINMLTFSRFKKYADLRWQSCPIKSLNSKGK